MTKDKVLKIAQWAIIAILVIACIWLWLSSKKSSGSVISEGQYSKSETQYVVISDDKTLKELKKVNEELHDSIKMLTDVTEAIQIKYITTHSTDTVYFNTPDTPHDSVYHYIEESDTINYDLKIKAAEVDWFKLNFSIRDSLMIVTRNKNGQSETVITHGENTDIINSTVYVPSKTKAQKFKERFYYGVGVGAGYGIINNKPDIFIGVSAGIRF